MPQLKHLRRWALGLCLVSGTTIALQLREPSRPTTVECETVLERYVSRLVPAVSGDVPASERAAREREALRQTRESDAVRECTGKLAANQVRCAATAATLDEMERCLLP